MTFFLDSVLPTQGVYCAVGIHKGVVKQTFHSSIADLEAIVTTHDTEKTDAYFAMASFQDSSGRTIDNALYLRSFYLDIDCGLGKPYKDQVDAAVALNAFITATGLPSPTINNSGGGLHVFWPLIDDVSVAVWVPIARALKALTKKHNLFADSAITADAARILRVPGTTNYKQAIPRPVQLVAAGQPSLLAAITDCLDPLPVDLSAAKLFGMDEVSKDLSGGEYPACSFRRLMQRSSVGTGCKQLLHAVQEQATLEEPLWRAALSIATRCTDGAKAIQMVSQYHPAYSLEITQTKAEETRGPYTCQWYKDNYSEGCKGCTQKISSPIVLGKVVEETETLGDVYVIETPINPEKPAEFIRIEIPTYPFPYFRGAKGGVFRKIQDKEGVETEEEIYHNDLYITERFFDTDEFGDGEGELVQINLHMDQDGLRRFGAPVTSLFAIDKLRDLLIKNGVVAYGKKLNEIMAYFSASIRKLQAQYSANKTRSQMGWTPDMLGFVVGELEYTASGTKLAPPSSGTRQFAPSFRPKGSLDKWREMASFYNRPGMEPHALALFFGFGAPLLQLVGGEAVKGVLVNLKSNGSGSGKSTAQMVVNSIFGHPTELLMTKDDTYASKMHRIGMMHSMAFTIDEITNTTDQELSDTAYGVTTGRARHRMESQTNKLRINRTTWCTITLTSANGSIIDKLAQLKATADGELKRIIELDVPAISGLNKTEVDLVFKELSKNYGVAGPIYISHIVETLPKVRELLIKIQAQLDQDFNFELTDRFHSGALACAFVGGMLALRLGLIDIDISRIYQYAISAIAVQKLAHVGSVGTPMLIAQETLSAYINENVNNALVVDGKTNNGIPPAPIVQPRGALKLRYEPDTKLLFITAADFRKFFASKQVDVKESIKWLVQNHILIPPGIAEVKRIGAGAVGGLSGLGVRCYVFDGTAIGIDEASFQKTEAPSTGT